MKTWILVLQLVIGGEVHEYESEWLGEEDCLASQEIAHKLFFVWDSRCKPAGE